MKIYSMMKWNNPLKLFRTPAVHLLNLDEVTCLRRRVDVDV